MTFRREQVWRPRGHEFKRKPAHSYGTFINGQGINQAYHFMEVKTKSLVDIMEELRINNEKAGRKFDYTMSHDNMAATWSITYTNVDRIVKGKTKRFRRGVENNE
jgi:hypothetical protein